MRYLVAAFLAGVLMLPVAASPQHLSADGAAQTFNFLSDQYFEQIFFKYSPTSGTAAGLHQYDTQLEDYSAASVQRQAAALRDIQKKLEQIDPSALDAEPAGDYAILLGKVRAQLLDLETIRT